MTVLKIIGSNFRKYSINLILASLCLCEILLNWTTLRITLISADAKYVNAADYSFRNIETSKMSTSSEFEINNIVSSHFFYLQIYCESLSSFLSTVLDPNPRNYVIFELVYTDT